MPKELISEWAIKDPIDNYELWLVDEEIMTQDECQEIRSHFKEQIQKDVEQVFEWEEGDASIKNELTDVYAPFQFIEQQAKPSSTRQIRFIDSIKEGLDQAMEKHSNLVLIGQDIAGYGGVFKITEGLMDKYGSARVRNTPICESAIIGAGLGLSLGGLNQW